MTNSADTPTPVPKLVGLAATDAHDAALDAQLLAVPQNAWHTAAGRSSVTGQEPAAGEEVTPGSKVSIWVEDPHGPPSTGGGQGPDDGPGGGGGGSPVTTGPGPLPSAGHA